MSFVRALLLSLIFSIHCHAQSPSTATNPLRAFNDALVAVFEKAAPSVVVIDVTKKSANARPAVPKRKGMDLFLREPERDFLELPDPAPTTEGSGVILRSDGYILTNSHVVEDSESIVVRLKNGASFPATLVGVDAKTDIAVLKIETDGLAAAELGNSDALQVGQLVTAIGTPYNLDYTFTLGVISALGRSNLQQVDYEEYIQTDASINPGNSGGPLCDIDGRVIGINTLINGINRGLSFAIPINLARGVADELIASGRIVRPWLGIRIQSLSETLAAEPSLRTHFKGIERGVVVETIEPGTPALSSDLRPADVITKVDGVFISDSKELQKEILNKKVGQDVELTVWRDNKTLTFSLRTAEMPDDTRPAALLHSAAPPTSSGDERFGLNVSDLTPENIKQFDIKLKSGVLVTSVREDSAAAQAGILVEDVITVVDSKTIQRKKDFTKALDSMDPERGALLFLDRKGEKSYALLKP